MQTLIVVEHLQLYWIACELHVCKVVLCLVGPTRNLIQTKLMENNVGENLQKK